MSVIFSRAGLKLTGKAAEYFGKGLGAAAASVGAGAGVAIVKESKAFTKIVDKHVKTNVHKKLEVTDSTPGSLVVHLEAETKEACDELLKSYLNGELLAIIKKAVQEYAEKYDDPQPVYDEIKIIYFREGSVPAESVRGQPTFGDTSQNFSKQLQNLATNQEESREEQQKSHQVQQILVKGQQKLVEEQQNQRELLNKIYQKIQHPKKKSSVAASSVEHQPITTKNVQAPSCDTEENQQKFLEEEQIDTLLDKFVEKYKDIQPSTRHGHEDFNNSFLLKGEPFYDDQLFVKVYIIHKKSDETKQPLCAKIINKNICESTNEEGLLLSLKDPNVVHYYGLWSMDSDQSYAFVMELCCTTVEDYLKKPQQWIDIKNGEKVTDGTDIRDILPISHLEILKQSTLGLQYLHSEGIIHRDIQPSNFFVTDKTGKAIVKIGDFGISRKIQSIENSSVYTKVCSTEKYQPPEAFEKGEDEKLIGRIYRSYDIFGFGIMWYFVLTNGKGHPFGGIDDHRYNVKHRNPPTLKLQAFDDSLSKEQKITARELVRQMLEFDPEKRCTIEDVYKHPVFWEASKKCSFLKDAHKHIEDKLTKVPKGAKIKFPKKCKDDDFHERLNHFDERLLLDCDKKKSAVKKEFPISFEILPLSVREVTGMHKVKSCRNVEEFLKVMRNKASHEEELSDPEKKELFGDKKSVEKWETFLNCFLEDREQLLVHLYQVFEDEKGLNEYC